MKRYVVLIIGILCLIAAFVWMCILKESAGPFLILGALSGALIVEGIHQIRKKKE